MDDNGDAEGNYTLLSIDTTKPPGLYPLAVLHKLSPVSNYLLVIYLISDNLFVHGQNTNKQQILGTMGG